MKCVFFFLIGVLIVGSGYSRAESDSRVVKSSEESLWEYGVGLGYAHYEMYPASSQMVDLVLPFPTFQYRGTFLRADDQDGARAYLLKDQRWWVELSGNGYPPVLSSRAPVRSGMSNIPISAQIGPRLSLKLTDALEFRFALYQSFLVDLHYQRKNGVFPMAELHFELAQNYFDLKGLGTIKTTGSVSYNLKGASKEFMDVYYAVPVEEATTDRRNYQAEAGVLVQQLIYIQTLHRQRASMYFGFIYNDYSFAKNRESPLARSSQNLAAFFSLTYTLGKSKKDSVPDSQTDGVIDRVIHR